MQRALSYLLLSAAVLGADGAYAQDVASGGSAGIETVIVTAEKRTEKVSDVPMSITTATGEELRSRGITQVSDLQKIVPGFTYQTSYLGTPIYTLRGVGLQDTSAAAAPTVSVYVDQVPLPYSLETEGVGLDVARVEVLQGPQGTLFGQNSTGGAINYIANKPTENLQAGLDVGYGNFNAFNAQGFVSGPVSDNLLARLAVNTDQRGNWQESETRHAGLGQKNFSDGRLILDFNPNGAIRAELGINGWIDKSDTQAAQLVAVSLNVPATYSDIVPQLLAYQPAPHDARVADWVPGSSLARDDTFYQTSLRVDWDLSDQLSLTSISAYSGLDQNSPTDVDGTDLPDLSIRTIATIHSFSEELRLAGQSQGGRMHFMIGGNYASDKTREGQFAYDYDATNSGFGPFRYHSFENENNHNVGTSAAFGSVDYAITDTITARGSLRYTQSNTDFRGCLRDTGNGELATAFSLLALNPLGPGQCVTLNPATFTAPPIIKAKLDQNNVSWRTGLDWKPDADTLLYANVTKGYKAGGFSTLPAAFSSQDAPIPQESVLAYEAGIKAAAAHHTLEFSAAGFYYDYSDKQLLGYITTPFGNLPGLVSVPKARVTGGELQVTWEPIDNFVLEAGGTYVSSDVSANFLTNDPFGAIVNIKGEEFPNTPSWQLNADAQYTFTLTDDLGGYVGGSLQYRGRSNSAFGDAPLFILPAYTLLDLRAGISSEDGKWRAEFWGRNVTDTFYRVQVDHVIDTVAQTVGMPATYGVTLSYRYN